MKIIDFSNVGNNFYFFLLAYDFFNQILFKFFKFETHYLLISELHCVSQEVRSSASPLCKVCCGTKLLFQALNFDFFWS